MEELDLNDVFFRAESSPVPAPGRLLVASPLLADAWFARSVVLLLEQDSEGGFVGLVLNKPSGQTMADIMPDWADGAGVGVNNGGPVGRDRLFLLHDQRELAAESKEIVPGVRVGGDMRTLARCLRAGAGADGSPLRFFLGYSGWSPGQLEEEIRSGAWMVNPDPGAPLFFDGNGERFWRREVGRLGEKCRNWLLMPEDPAMN